MYKKKYKILFITTQLPFPKDTGGKNVTAAFINKMKDIGSVDVIGKYDGLMTKGELFHHIERFKIENSHINEVYCTNWWIKSSRHKWRAIFTFIKSIYTKKPYKIIKHYSKKFDGVLNGLLEDNNYDLLIFDQLGSYNSKEIFQNTPKILITHNVEYDTVIVTNRSFIMKKLLDYERQKLLIYETNIYKTIKNIVFLTEDDKKTFDDINSNFVVLNPTLSQFTNSPEKQNFNINFKVLILGSLSWSHNVRSIFWYLENIHDKILNQYPQYILIIVGSGGGRSLINRLKKYKNVDVRGYVEDLLGVMNEADFMLSLAYSGSGIKIKVIDAIGRKMPCVVSEHSLKGLPFRIKERMVSFNTEDDLIRIIQNIFQGQYNMENNATKLKEDIKSCGFKYSNLKKYIIPLLKDF